MGHIIVSRLVSHPTLTKSLIADLSQTTRGFQKNEAIWEIKRKKEKMTTKEWMEEQAQKISQYLSGTRPKPNQTRPHRTRVELELHQHTAEHRYLFSGRAAFASPSQSSSSQGPSCASAARSIKVRIPAPQHPASAQAEDALSTTPTISAFSWPGRGARGHGRLTG